VSEKTKIAKNRKHTRRV